MHFGSIPALDFIALKLPVTTSTNSHSRSAMIHVIPIDDAIEHVMDGSCCEAFVDDNLMIHHSKDKRENYERVGHVGRPWGLFTDEKGFLQFVDTNDQQT